MTAAQVGVMRNVSAIRAGKTNQHGFDEDGWNIHIEGACGELAAAKALNIYWDGSVNTFKKGADVGPYQIRTRSKHSYDLLVRNDDRDEDIFILVTGRAPEFVVHGWLSGRDAKQDRFLKDHGNRHPAFFVPKSELRPLSTL